MPDIKKLKRVLKQKMTPLYFYDSAVVKQRCIELRKNLPVDFEIFYAVKANPNKGVVSILGRLGAGADVASRGELDIALKAGIKPCNISFAGPGKTREELEYAVRKEIASISVESLEEGLMIDALSKKWKRVTNISIRVNPALGSQSAGLRMGGGSQQFGIDEESVEEVIKKIKLCKHLDIIGIHMHTGSQILSEETVAQNIEYLLSYCIQLQNKSGVTIRFINVGGGLGIPYYKGQSDLDMKKLGRLIKNVLLKTGTKTHLKKARLIIEPGRFLVGESGTYVTKILYRKQSRGKRYLIVDGGMHQNLAAAGLLGEGLRRSRIFGVIRRKGLEGTEIVTIAGCLCTPLDILGRDIELPVCESGDHLYITSSGAYGYSASPTMFLSHELPSEAIA